MISNKLLFEPTLCSNSSTVCIFVVFVFYTKSATICFPNFRICEISHKTKTPGIYRQFQRNIYKKKNVLRLILHPFNKPFF